VGSEVGSGAWQAGKVARDLCVLNWSSVATTSVLTALACEDLPELDVANTWVSVNIPGTPQAQGLGFAITNTKAIRTDGLNGLTLVHDLALVGYLTDANSDGTLIVTPDSMAGEVFDQQVMERAVNGWAHIAAILLASPTYGLVNYSTRNPLDTSGVFNFDPDDAFAPKAADSSVDPYQDQQQYLRVYAAVGRIYQRTLLPV
jgi:hypothetical protein